MTDTLTAIVGWLAPILSTIIIAAATASINMQVAKAQRTADERHEETERKRKTEVEWRNEVDKLLQGQDAALKSVAEDRIDWYAWREQMVAHMTNQDERIMSMLKAQCTQMRSDTVHRAHRYLDDLGCASTEEKSAFWAEYEDYCELCEQYGIENSFVDTLAKRVMALPERTV